MASEFTIARNRTLDAMKTMASAMTHDFNSILTTIVYSIELALDDISEDTLTYQDLNRVLEASVEASEYIATIMSFCKPAKSGFVSLDVKQLADQAVESIKTNLPGTVTLGMEAPVGAITAKADPEQMNQIIEHLIKNAAQALEPKGGRIAMRISRGAMPGPDNAGKACLVLTVTDNGPGIAENIIPMIFDPFFTTRPKGLHKGLGLSIVHSFVENHDGLIKVSSKPDQQTTFDIYLPVIENI